MERVRDQRPVLLRIVAASEATIGQEGLSQFGRALHVIEDFEAAAECGVGAVGPFHCQGQHLRLPLTHTTEPPMASEETKITSGSLIAAEKVEGTDVYNMRAKNSARVEDIMIDKVSGRACYAVMSFGGFLGIGEKTIRCPGRR